VANVEIDVRVLEIQFRTHAGVAKSMRDIDLRIDEGETLCLIGESGSGKSVMAHPIMRLLLATGDIRSI
jgi:ABC-type dipeptide/oligopeptide/nickel transport system ATPase component